jgi:hypothetical protein
MLPRQVEEPILTLHWNDMCSRFMPPMLAGAPNNVGPKTILRLETDIWLTDSFRRILLQGK